MIATKKADQFLLRFPPGLRARLAGRAASSGRSLNTEIIVAIEQHLEGASRLDVLWREYEQRTAQ
jgi:predicted HicB family RNase H-like nuclease